MCGKNFQIYRVHIPRKCIESRHFCSRPSPLKTRLQVLVILPSAEEYYSFPLAAFFQKSVFPVADTGGGNYDLLHQNSIRTLSYSYFV